MKILYLILMFFCSYELSFSQENNYEYGSWGSVLFRSKVSNLRSHIHYKDSIVDLFIKNYPKYPLVKSSIDYCKENNINVKEYLKSSQWVLHYWKDENELIDKEIAQKIIKIYSIRKTDEYRDSITTIVNSINQKWRLKKTKLLSQKYEDILENEVNDWINAANKKFETIKISGLPNISEIDSLCNCNNITQLKLFFDKIHRPYISSIYTDERSYYDINYEKRLETHVKNYCDFIGQTFYTDRYKKKHIRKVGHKTYNSKSSAMPIVYTIYNWVECFAVWNARTGCHGKYDLIAPDGWQVCKFNFRVTTKRGTAKEDYENEYGENMQRLRTRFSYHPIEWYKNDKEYPSRFKGYRLSIKAYGNRNPFNHSDGKIKLSNVGLTLIPDNYTNIQRQECDCTFEFPSNKIQRNITPKEIKLSTSKLPDNFPNKIPDDENF